MTAQADRTAPGVRLTLLPAARAAQGEPVDLTGRIVSFSYEDSESKADKVALTLDNFDLSFFDRPELLGGALLEVSWGYPGNMAPPRRVTIKKLKGFATLTIEGQALSTQMNQQAKTRGWENKKRSDVVREIAAAYGYEGSSVIIEDTKESFDVINQSAETDAWFLRRLADREHFAFFVDDTGFHWHRRKQDTAPHRVFTWFADPDRGDILSIDIESDLMKRAGSVTVKGRDPLERATVEETADKDKTSRTTLGDDIEVVSREAGFDTTIVSGADAAMDRLATDAVHPTSATTPAQAKREADARFIRAERETVKLTMQVVGDPSLRAKTIVEVRGISARFSGKYHVNEVKHAISSSGYVCDLKLTRDGHGGGGAGGGGGGGGGQAPSAPLGGDKNTSPVAADGKLKEVEAVDGETGGTAITYQVDNDPPGGSDPEARPGAKE